MLWEWSVLYADWQLLLFSVENNLSDWIWFLRMFLVHVEMESKTEYNLEIDMNRKRYGIYFLSLNGFEYLAFAVSWLMSNIIYRGQCRMHY